MAKAKSETKPAKKSPSTLILAVVAGLSLLASLVFFYYLFLAFYQGRFYPGVRISGVEMGGKTPAYAQSYFNSNFNQRVKTPLSLNSSKIQYQINLASAEPTLDIESQITQAYLIGRSDNILLGLQQQFKAIIIGYNFSPTVEFKNLANLKAQIDQLNQKVEIPAKPAQITLEPNLTIIPSQDGQKVDRDKLVSQLKSYLAFQSQAPQTFGVVESKAQFNTAQAGQAKLALERIKANPIKLSYQNNSWMIDQTKLYSLLYLGLPNTEPVWDSTQPDVDPKTSLLLDKAKYNDLLDEISAKIYQEAHDARFSYDPTLAKVTQFQDAQNGQQLDRDQVDTQIFQALNDPPHHSQLNLPVNQTQAKITTASVNNFGIHELIGQGQSVFTGSIDNRIYNLKLAASRINGVLIAPGETFSFVKTVGDITAATGYKPAYVIRSGRTVLDDGGGVCQASTTLFRAILNAGLPVVERTAHAYRVHYYEEGGYAPGLDATIFYPSVDLKFKNDTPGYILIQSYSQGENLFVDLYGTSDGRVSTVSTPKIISQTPPPPDLKQDDPTLPKGTVKQVDWSAWGANVVFSRTVTRDGQTLINETFKSVYKPWQAVYLVGTKEG